MLFITQGKANIKYLLIVVLVAAVAGGIIYITWKDCQKEIIILNNFTEIKKSAKNIESEIADWKTYTDNEYGFEIKYPKDWTYGASLITMDKPDDIEFCSPLEYAVANNPSLGCIHYDRTSSMSDTPKTLASIFLFISSKEIPQQTNCELKKVIVNDISMSKWCSNAYWEKGDYFYALSSSGYAEIFDKMLSTFNFIESIYTACGCGCCIGVEPTASCLYHSKGDDIQKIIEQDKKIAQSPNCAMTGCSQPVKYYYCD